MSASLCPPCKQVHLHHFSRFNIPGLTYYTCFSLPDSLHSVTASRSIHTSAEEPVLLLSLGCLVSSCELPRWLSGKNTTCQHRRHGFSPRVGKISWRRKWQPTPVLCLGNPMDRGVWWATVHGVATELDTTEQQQQQYSNVHIYHIFFIWAHDPDFVRA